jgi:substrate-binding family protein
MSSKYRFRLLAISTLALASLAACVNPGGPRPTTPTYSGAMRPDPSRPARPEDPIPSDPVNERYADSRNAYMPRYIARDQSQAIKRVAVALPFSATDPTIQSYTRAIYNAIQLALFERPENRNVVLMPRDTAADAATAANVVDDAIKDGAVAVIGPLLSPQVAAVAGKAAQVRAPVFAFSTDPNVVGQGAYLVAINPKTEVKRIVEWASQQGVTRFGMFGPDTPYGRAVDVALREEAAARGATVFAIEYYANGNTNPADNARRIASSVQAENRSFPNKVAVIIPESGTQLRTVGSLLRAFSNTNQREVRFLGTGTWNDADVWREPSLEGSAFPAPDPAAVTNFESKYQQVYGELPPKVASFGYDAGALVAALASEDRLDAAMIQRTPGFGGVNGLYRYLPDGSTERALAVMQLQGRTGAKVIVPALQAFGPGS